MYTQLTSQPEQFDSPHFDKYQFDNSRGRFLKGSKLDFRDVERMHILPISNEQKGRRQAVPEWSASNEAIQQVIVHYLTTRFAVRNSKGSLQNRLARCSAAGKLRALKEKRRTQQKIQEYRAISEQRFHELEPISYVRRLFSSARRGENFAEHLRLVELQIQNCDSTAFVAERAAEIAASVCYLAYRMGWPSPSISEQLHLKAPAVRQILARLNRAARRLKMGAPMPKPRGRPRSFSGQTFEKKAA